MSVRIRAVGWDVIEKLLTLYFILKEASENRKLLLKGARLALKVARWTLIKSVGASIVFLSTVVLCVLPIASWFFVQAGLTGSPAQLVPLTFGASVAILLYGFVGLVGLGNGTVDGRT